MRLHRSLALGATVLLLTAGCTATPEPRPEPTASASASPTPTPTAEPIVEPDAAFDVTCADVAAAMAPIVGEASAPVEPVLSVDSAPSWYPGPAQHMFQRAGGIACSAGGEGAGWEVTIVPDAPSVIQGATERQGYWGPRAQCEDGRCAFEIPDGDVLLSASVVTPGLQSADTARLEEALRSLAATAAASVHDIELADSEIVGAHCERFMTVDEVNLLAGADDAALYTDFGGWGIPAEVYQVVNGARICYFASEGSEYEGNAYLLITWLPAGAWAFEREAGDPVAVEGADDAKVSMGAHGQRALDLRIGTDWIRLTTYDNGAGADDPLPFAQRLVQNLTVGRPAPQ